MNTEVIVIFLEVVLDFAIPLPAPFHILFNPATAPSSFHLERKGRFNTNASLSMVAGIEQFLSLPYMHVHGRAHIKKTLCHILP